MVHIFDEVHCPQTIGTREKEQFTCIVLHILSHGVNNFIASVVSKKHSDRRFSLAVDSPVSMKLNSVANACNKT